MNSSVPNAQLAMSVADYPVTAGDVYTLAFAAGSTPVTYSIPVDSSYRVRVANMGSFNCAGLTYLQLKRQVEDLVSRNYPMSGAQFVLSVPATFRVTVTGEVRATKEESAWALTRLSSFITQNFTQYSSSRDIQVVSAGGKTKKCDLFKARREGDLSQDPYLRPGDKIVVGKMERKVSIGGAVERPGTYELLAGENLKSLVEYYAGGFSPEADVSRISLHRIGDDSEGGKKGGALYLNADSVREDKTVLLNGDAVTVGGLRELLGVVFFEGAVGALGREEQNQTETIEAESVKPQANRIPVRFFAGENYADLVRRYGSNFIATSDLRNAWLERDGKRIPVNLEDFLYKADFKSELVPAADDTLYVPFMQERETVLVTGEVLRTEEVEAWPLKRLSELVQGRLTDWSSTRKVTVTSIDGESAEYDLFLASRFGRMEQNPYVRPGETVTVNRMERKVSIGGAVERPGTYELLAGENLKSLVEYYGSGLTPTADPSRIELLRVLTEKDGAGEKTYLGSDAIKEDYALVCYDAVVISDFGDLKPVVFVEGAVQQSAEAALETSTRISATFNEGEDYAYFVRRNRGWFSAVSDLSRAYIIRGEEHIAIDLVPLLYDASNYSEIEIKANDILIVPFRQYFVSVSGAVYNPGRYPYIPDRTWDYYVNLAGGIIRERNTLDAVEIRDIDGNKLSKKDTITPETTIEVKTNSGLYFFNQYAPVITTILSVISTCISVLAVTGVF